MVNKHIEDSLEKIRLIFLKASARIEAIKPGEKIPATVLADQLAKEIDMKGPSLYPTLLFLFKDYPGIEIRKGAQGGIVRLDPNKPKAVKVTAVVPVVSVEDISSEKEVQPIINT